MANDDAARGLVPVRNLRGGFIRLGKYTIASAYATALYRGDPVALVGSGRSIQIATAGATNLVLGAFKGCRYKKNTGEFIYSAYWPASQVATDIEALVWDDPQTVFRIQCDTGTSLAAADIGLNMDLVSGTGSATTGNSGWEADISTKATTANLQLKTLGLSETYNSDKSANAYGEHAKIDVLINQHALFAAGVAGV